MRLVSQWKKRLGGELGPLYERLFEWATEPRLSDSLTIDDPGADAGIPKAMQKKLGLHVIGRTGVGVFGVEQSSTEFPIEDRPIFVAPFGRMVSDDLASFLRDDPALGDVRPRLTELTRLSAKGLAGVEEPSNGRARNDLRERR